MMWTSTVIHGCTRCVRLRCVWRKEGSVKSAIVWRRVNSRSTLLWPTFAHRLVTCLWAMITLLHCAPLTLITFWVGLIEGCQFENAWGYRAFMTLSKQGVVEDRHIEWWGMPYLCLCWRRCWSRFFEAQVCWTGSAKKRMILKTGYEKLAWLWFWLWKPVFWLSEPLWKPRRVVRTVVRTKAGCQNRSDNRCENHCLIRDLNPRGVVG